jgi:hypothetical protein
MCWVSFYQVSQLSLLYWVLLCETLFMLNVKFNVIMQMSIVYRHLCLGNHSWLLMAEITHSHLLCMNSHWMRFLKQTHPNLSYHPISSHHITFIYSPMAISLMLGLAHRAHTCTAWAYHALCHSAWHRLKAKSLSVLINKE